METEESGVLVCWVNSGDLEGEYYFTDDSQHRNAN